MAMEINPERLSAYAEDLSRRGDDIAKAAPKLEINWDALGQFDEAVSLVHALNVQVADVAARLNSTAKVLHALASVATEAATLASATDADVATSMAKITSTLDGAETLLTGDAATLAASNKLANDEVTAMVYTKIVIPLEDAIGNFFGGGS